MTPVLTDLELRFAEDLLVFLTDQEPCHIENIVLDELLAYVRFCGRFLARFAAA